MFWSSGKFSSHEKFCFLEMLEIQLVKHILVRQDMGLACNKNFSHVRTFHLVENSVSCRHPTNQLVKFFSVMYKIFTRWETVCQRRAGSCTKFSCYEKAISLALLN